MEGLMRARILSFFTDSSSWRSRQWGLCCGRTRREARFILLLCMLRNLGPGCSAAGLLILPAMASLWRFRGGLPMNASLLHDLWNAKSTLFAAPHLGRVLMACAGAAILAGSASGLWLVTPCVVGLFGAGART